MLNKTKLNNFADFENDTLQFFVCHFQTVVATKMRLQQDCRSFNVD